MAYQVGYWTDLSSLKLDDVAGDTVVQEIMAMPYGKYDHPVYGEIDFNPEVGAEAAQNVNIKARGQDLDIDYDHKQYHGEAAGWVKSAEARADGVWLTVEWTKKAAQLIKDKAYRYFSPEFKDEWTHPKTKATFKNVLFGGAITNRPFLKDILPLNMSEMGLMSEPPHSEEGTRMDPKELRKKLGLPEDATDEQVNTALAAKAAPDPDDKGGGDPPDDKGKVDDKKEPEPALMSEAQLQEVIKLSENNPVLKQLVDTVGALQTQVVTQGQALAMAEVNAQVKQLMEPIEGKRQLPAVAAPKLAEVLATPSRKGVLELMEAINKAGYVTLGEHGPGHEPDDASTAAKRFNDAVTKVMESDKLEYADAVERVAAIQPQLYSEYREAAYSFKEA